MPLRPYFRQLAAEPPLTPDEERRLAARIAAGDPEARDRLARANLRLVVHIARAYRGRGLGPEDLVAEGNLGLLRAVEGYDGRAGVRFATYAAPWIRQSIRAALFKHGRPVRLPQHAGTLLGRARRARAALAGRLGREPADEEVADALRLPPKKRAILRDALRVHRSGGRAGAEADGTDPFAALADGRSRPAGAELAEAETRRRVLARLSGLGDREAAVVRLRYGLGGAAPMTHREVGERLGLSRQRAQQIERGALAALAAGR
jgi:RNA polymerase primary sigma factor